MFIPCKLSTNEGFETVNVLRDIRFTGNRGEVIAFLDCDNFSKRTLFEVIANNQQSDSHFERDLKGEVRFSERVKLSLILGETPFFEDLNVLERLRLFSTLRDPSAP